MPPRKLRSRAVASPPPPMAPISAYELNIQKQRAETQALLAKLKSDCISSGVPLPSTQSSAPKPARKRKAPAAAASAPIRRSSRVSRKPVPFIELAEGDDVDEPGRKPKTARVGPSARDFINDEEDENVHPRQAPRVNGRVFGAIPGVPVGSWWEFRDSCGRAGIHPPTVAGIYGGAETGAYSVAVSAGYPEDLDLGDTFTYTGSGGRELKKKNLRTAPQSSDQTLTRGNAALDMSARTGEPVRVIRGYKAAMGPLTGYRYDGLYKVVRSYEAKNSEGKFKVYKFDFERLPGQVPVDYGEKERIQAEEAVAAQVAQEAAEAEKAQEEDNEGEMLAVSFESADD